ncbi:MAG: hypothetical protein IKR23_02005 [Lachnospiraceae bacterium]|nr:hypothetical protein [Lachnospiraceae bacterium]
MNNSYFIFLIVYGIILGAVKGGLIRLFKLRSKEKDGLQPFTFITSAIMTGYYLFFIVMIESAGNTLSGNSAGLLFVGMLFQLLLTITAAEVIWMLIRIKNSKGGISLAGSLFIPLITNIAGLFFMIRIPLL